MKENSRIRFNPVTKEIEIEGSESFVKIYFKKIQAMVSEPAAKTTPVKKAKKKVTSIKAGPRKKANKATKKAPGAAKRVTNIDVVVGLIRDSAEGISTSELKERTGLSELQIWGIVNRAAKGGRIRKLKRGFYGAAAASGV